MRFASHPSDVSQAWTISDPVSTERRSYVRRPVLCPRLMNGRNNLTARAFQQQVPGDHAAKASVGAGHEDPLSAEGVAARPSLPVESSRVRSRVRWGAGDERAGRNVVLNIGGRGP